jgi:hypothetical protein
MPTKKHLKKKQQRSPNPCKTKSLEIPNKLWQVKENRSQKKKQNKNEKNEEKKSRLMQYVSYKY